MNHENDQENLKQLSLAPVQVITSRPLRLSEVEEMDAQEETPNDGGGDGTDNRPINGEPELACIVQDQEMEEDEARSEATFRYTVENISKMKDSQLSPACYVRNLPWKIKVMPRSSQTQDRQPQRSLGFFLQCNGESESTSWSCYAVAELRLLSCKEGQEAFSRKIEHLFYSEEDDWGYRYFINWQDVLDPDRGFIKDDSITLESPARNKQQQRAPINADIVTSTAEAVTEVPGAIKTTINIGFAMNHENDQENLKQLSLAPVQVITSRPLRLSEVEEMDAQEETPNNGGGDRTDNRPIIGEPELACIVQDQEMEEDEARSEATFRYTVENISKMKDFQLTSESYDRNIQLSPACYIQNLPWKIMVMPRVLSRSLDRQQQRTLGFYLQCNGERESTSWSCYAVAELRLLSCKEGQEAFSRKIQHLFCSKENDWGYRHFINWQDVLDPDRGFIKDDSITLEVHVVADVPHGDSWDSNRLHDFLRVQMHIF